MNLSSFSCGKITISSICGDKIDVIHLFFFRSASGIFDLSLDALRFDAPQLYSRTNYVDHYETLSCSKESNSHKNSDAKLKMLKQSNSKVKRLNFKFMDAI